MLSYYEGNCYTFEGKKVKLVKRQKKESMHHIYAAIFMYEESWKKKRNEPTKSDIMHMHLTGIILITRTKITSQICEKRGL